jgi:hypothetical protein
MAAKWIFPQEKSTRRRGLKRLRRLRNRSDVSWEYEHSINKSKSEGAMEESSGASVDTFSLAKRLFLVAGTVLIFGSILFFTFTFTQHALAPSSLPLWVRLPLFAFPAMLAVVAVWFGFQLYLLWARNSARKSGEAFNVSPFWSDVQAWAPPVLFTVIAITMAFSAFAFAAFAARFSSPTVRQLQWLMVFTGMVFIPLSLIFPIKLLRRRLRTGKFLLTRDEETASRKHARRPKSLKKRITAVTLTLFLALLETYLALASDHHRTVSWVLAILWWYLVAITSWELVLPSKPGREAAPASQEGQAGNF